MKFPLGVRRNNEALSFPELLTLTEARSSSRAGGGTIIVYDLTHHSDTNHPRQKCSYPATSPGRLRSLKRVQRPHSP